MLRVFKLIGGILVVFIIVAIFGWVVTGFSAKAYATDYRLPEKVVIEKNIYSEIKNIKRAIDRLEQDIESDNAKRIKAAQDIQLLQDKLGSIRDKLFMKKYKQGEVDAPIDPAWNDDELIKVLEPLSVVEIGGNGV